jgi:predicted fused transcriptional regulator/phosphomethylpyrimidine kinase
MMTTTVHQRVGILVGGNQIIQGNAAFHTLVQSVGTNVAHIRVTAREDHGVATVRIEFFKANHAVEGKGCRHG